MPPLSRTTVVKSVFPNPGRKLSRIGTFPGQMPIFSHFPYYIAPILLNRLQSTTLDLVQNGEIGALVDDTFKVPYCQSH